MPGVNCIDYSTMSVSGTATALGAGASPSIPTRARGAVITLEDANLRYRIDGTDPTASEGMILYADSDPLVFDSWAVPKQNWRSVLQAISFIQAVANSTGKLKVHWYD